MKFKAVEFMREARNRIYEETKGLPYEKHKEYLERHSSWFTANKSFQQMNKIKDHGTEALKINTEYSLAELDALFDFSYKKPSGIKKSKSGDVFLFSTTLATQYQDTQEKGVIYFQGQNTGGSHQQLIFGNKDLYDAYKNREIKIHLFKNNVYLGEHTIIKEPYKESGKWIFPLSNQ